MLSPRSEGLYQTAYWLRNSRRILPNARLKFAVFASLEIISSRRICQALQPGLPFFRILIVDQVGDIHGIDGSLGFERMSDAAVQRVSAVVFFTVGDDDDHSARGRLVLVQGISCFNQRIVQGRISLEMKVF